MDQLVRGQSQDDKVNNMDAAEAAQMMSSGGDGAMEEPFDDRNGDGEMDEEGLEEGDMEGDDMEGHHDEMDEGPDDGQEEMEEGMEDDDNMALQNDEAAAGQMDYDQMDMRICGDLIDKNKKLDEFFMSQNLDGQIKVRIE